MVQNNTENKNIGKNIRLYRIKAGLTIRELGRQIHKVNGLVIKTGSLRNYEKGTEKIPAVALHNIAAITRTDIRAFYEEAHPVVLLDSRTKIHLVEAFCMIRQQSARDALLHLARKLGK